MYLTLQHNAAIMVYKKSSGMKDTAVRLIQGDKTRMGDPHGIAFDPKNRLLYVANYGTGHQVKMGTTGSGGRPRIPNWPAGNYGQEIIKGTGRFDPPSIVVLPADSNGDVAPLRVIQGPKTGFNWPTGVAFDSERQELYVANQAGGEILVFRADQQGDVAPIRVLKGPKTLMKNPSDVFLDFANNEMWVASFGNHKALAFRLGASGDTAPIRVVRGARRFWCRAASRTRASPRSRAPPTRTRCRSVRLKARTPSSIAPCTRSSTTRSTTRSWSRRIWARRS
jgi:DNA-binding beta-propeller fold protein YncE